MIMLSTQILRKLTLLVFSLFLFLTTQAQVHTSDALYQALYTQDSLLFRASFDTCDIELLRQMVSDDFEFYHDVSGVTPSKDAFILNTKNGLCKLSYKARRALVPGSLQVFPLKNNGKVYGAIQTGKHRFYAKEKDKPEYFTSSADFTHLWEWDGKTWKLKRVLSYNHQTED